MYIYTEKGILNPIEYQKRKVLSPLYRFSFNGKENDNEFEGTGIMQDYGMRIYSTILGKFISVDPLSKEYPYYSSYQFAGNSPIWATDLDGNEPDPQKENKLKGERSTTVEAKAAFLHQAAQTSLINNNNNPSPPDPKSDPLCMKVPATVPESTKPNGVDSPKDKEEKQQQNTNTTNPKSNGVGEKASAFGLAFDLASETQNSTSRTFRTLKVASGISTTVELVSNFQDYKAGASGKIQTEVNLGLTITSFISSEFSIGLFLFSNTQIGEEFQKMLHNSDAIQKQKEIEGAKKSEVPTIIKPKIN